mgnify:CR=1 FL=1
MQLLELLIILLGMLLLRSALIRLIIRIGALAYKATLLRHVDLVAIVDVGESVLRYAYLLTIVLLATCGQEIKLGATAAFIALIVEIIWSA